jgi:hypothetical protein
MVNLVIGTEEVEKEMVSSSFRSSMVPFLPNYDFEVSKVAAELPKNPDGLLNYVGLEVKYDSNPLSKNTAQIPLLSLVEAVCSISAF